MKYLIPFLFIFACSSPEKPKAPRKLSSDIEIEGLRYLGGLFQGSTKDKALSLVFTGDTHAEGANSILNVLEAKGVKANFFLTGNFLRNESFTEYIDRMVNDGHYLGAHSDKHLLYASWKDRKTLVTKKQFEKDLKDNYAELKKFGVSRNDSRFFIPSYEHYNKEIVEWSEDFGVNLFTFTIGTNTHKDFTNPKMNNYMSSKDIFNSIWEFERKSRTGLNGHIMLIHLGVGDKRTDKFYKKLEAIIKQLQLKGYQLKTVDDLFYRK